MQLLDLFNKYSASELIATIDAMFPDTEQFHPIFEQAYAIMKGLTPIASKKKIRYKVIYDEANDFEFFGAEDSCFATTWEVCIAKELIRNDEVELSDIEMAANSLVNMCLTGRCPREFLPMKQELLRSLEQ